MKGIGDVISSPHEVRTKVTDDLRVTLKTKLLKLF